MGTGERSARNRANVGERLWSAAEVSNSIHYHLMDCDKLKKPIKETHSMDGMRRKPQPTDTYKVNIDASFLASSNKGGWGYIARDRDGIFLDGGAGNITRAMSVLHAEAMAALHGLQRAAQLGMPRIILETDAANLGRALTSDDMDLSPEGGIFKIIRSFMESNFVSCNV
ncbi:hypothetical protein EJB05_11588, partial [Eragrostis curvula]